LAEQSEIDRHIHRVRAGEADAFESVVRAYEWPIRAFVISRCPPAGDADDVAQNTFIAAFRRIGEYEPGTDFKAWLFAIARYELLAEQTRLRRKADYHSRYAPHALMAELERRATDPAEALEPSSRLQHLRACVRMLDERGRNLLRWRYDENAPLAEMAKRTSRSVGAIKKNLFVIRRKLHDCIEQRLATEGP